MVIKQTLLMLLFSLLLSACASMGQSSQSSIKRISPEALQALIPEAVASYTLEEIVQDTKQAKSPEDIIEKIKASDSRYELSVKEILALNQQGVDVSVLNYIQENNELAKQNYIADEINKANNEKEQALNRLNQERLWQMNRFYDPFWGPFGGPFMSPFGRRFGGAYFQYPFFR